MEERKNRIENMKKKLRRKKLLIFFIPVIILAIIIGVNLNSQSTRRWFKSMQSEYTGGLNRTVTVYDNNGKEIRSWTGKLDVQESEYGNKVLFDLNGKRKTIYNAVVIVEEE